MREFINHLTERNFQNKTVAFIENGSWAPLANKVMKGMLEKSKNLNYANTEVTIRSAVNAQTIESLENLANELCQDYLAQRDETADKNDLNVLLSLH